MSYTDLDDDLRRRRGDGGSGAFYAVAAGAVIGAAALVYYQRETRNTVGYRPPDSAPARTARDRSGRYSMVGRTVTIAKPRTELYAFWRDFSNLPCFMQSVRKAESRGELTRWTMEGPLGGDVNVVTRITEDREGEVIAWRSTEMSDIETEGRVTFRDAPAGRGTEVEAVIAYVPPMGEIGRWVAKAFQAEPRIQGRRELKRLKMLMETGEIATSAMRKTDA